MHLHSTFVPLSAKGSTEQERIQNNPHVNWPPTTGNQINQFTSEGYVSSAFPTLFPTGTADLLAPQHRMVTLANYFKHTMTNDLPNTLSLDIWH